MGNRCHGTGHFQKNCPIRSGAAPEESRRSSGAAQKTVAALVATDELDVDHACKQKQQRRVDLRRVLQEAEVDGSGAHCSR